jgi:sulfite reductase (NADPH) hemoprotein beta-component
MRERQSFAEAADIDEFVETLEKFERGEISAEAWRKFRLVRGTYGQRQDDVHMLRVKIPQGILNTRQLTVVADVAEQFARGFAHVTTRQNIQFHFLQLHDVDVVMRLFADEGVTTREACGNSVRNITACPFAGVSDEEVFDVTPYAEALTRYLLRHPLASVLPRKFKIAFEGCSTDHAFASINDLGWTARIEDRNKTAVRGFRLTAGGGTSILPVAGRVLFDFVPAAEMLNVAEAILRVYHACGDHEHRQRNRMKFLIKSLGWEQWRARVLESLDAVRAAGGATLPLDANNPPVEHAPAWTLPAPPALAELRSLLACGAAADGPGIRPQVVSQPVTAETQRAWRHTNVWMQRQRGYAVVIMRLPLGDITAGQLRALALLAASFGDGTVRLTIDQNIFLRWVPVESLDDLFPRLAAIGLAAPGAGTIADVTSCPGAESCKLAVTQSRGLGRLLGDTLAARPDLAHAASDAVIKISGCPNGCGQHHIATLGFQGSVRKVDGRAVPQYFVMVGGGVGAEGATFARLAAKVPARRIDTALERLIDWYRRERDDGETARTFFARVTVPQVKAVLADLEVFDPHTASADDYIDLAETTAFVPEVGEGECAV